MAFSVFDAAGAPIVGRRLGILLGTSGLSEEKRLAYLSRWEPISTQGDVPLHVSEALAKKGSALGGMAMRGPYQHPLSPVSELRQHGHAKPQRLIPLGQIPRTVQPKPSGGVGTELKRMLAAIHISACGACGEMASEMDVKGVEWCETHKPYLLDGIMANAERRHWKLLEKGPTVFQFAVNWAAEITPDIAKRRVAKMLLDKAIEHAKAKQGQEVPVVPFSESQP